MTHLFFLFIPHLSRLSLILDFNKTRVYDCIILPSYITILKQINYSFDYNVNMLLIKKEYRRFQVHPYPIV